MFSENVAFKILLFSASLVTAIMLIACTQTLIIALRDAFFYPQKDLRRLGGRLPKGRAPISVQTSRLAFVRATYLPAGVGWERGRNARAEVLIMRANSQGGLSVVIRDSLSHSSEGLNGVMA